MDCSNWQARELFDEENNHKKGNFSIQVIKLIFFDNRIEILFHWEMSLRPELTPTGK